jgi:hypothetical protein
MAPDTARFVRVALATSALPSLGRPQLVAEAEVGRAFA